MLLTNIDKLRRVIAALDNRRAVKPFSERKIFIYISPYRLGGPDRKCVRIRIDLYRMEYVCFRIPVHAELITRF